MDELEHPNSPLWNGKLAMVGVAGSSRRLLGTEIAALVARGYAVAPMSIDPAANHALAQQARSILQTRHGREVRYALLLGFSASAGAALRTASLYPREFAGVIAGSTLIDPPGSADRIAALRLLIEGSPPKLSISSERLALLHARMMDAYDPEDGLIDGILYDPLACAVDPVLSAISQEPSARQWIESARAIYAMGAAPGSEPHWRPAISADAAAAVRAASEGFDFAAAVRPDLRAFSQAGGRLILFHGYNDVVSTPAEAIALFESIENAAGGPLAAAAFARLFLWPGLDHNMEGPSEGGVDYVELMERWLERSPPRPPDDPMLQRRPVRGNKLESVFAPPEMDAREPGFARLNFPFPLRTRFKRRGNPDDLKGWYAPGVYRRTREPIAASELPTPLPQDVARQTPLGIDQRAGPVLVVGATGRLGIEVVKLLADFGVEVRALVRDPTKAAQVLPPGAAIFVGDVREPQSVQSALHGVRRVVFAASATAGGEGENTPESVEYNGVRNVLSAGIAVDIAQFLLVSSAASTHHEHIHNLWGSILDWKFRSEALVRDSGAPYTIIRPGGLRPAPPDWPTFEAGIRGIRFVQGDRIAFGEEIHRGDLAKVIVGALADTQALGKTFEVYNDDTLPPGSWVGGFAELKRDAT